MSDKDKHAQINQILNPHEESGHAGGFMRARNESGQQQQLMMYVASDFHSMKMGENVQSRFKTTSHSNENLGSAQFSVH